MGADGAAQPIRIGIEQKIVEIGVALSDARNRSADEEVGEGAAVELTPDHRFGLLLLCYSATRGLAGDPSPEAGDILGELTIDQIAAIEAKVPVIRQIFRQDLDIFFVCREQRAVCQQAVFVSIAEQKFAQRQQIGVVLIGLRAGDPGRSQSNEGCEIPSRNPNGSVSSMSLSERISILDSPPASA